jgi:catechol 2,3-dioxygenase-like lactoylglutathione lyase family enzyme
LFVNKRVGSRTVDVHRKRGPSAAFQPLGQEPPEVARPTDEFRWRPALHLANPQHREVRTMDWKLELVIVPVSDVDRAKAFYTERVGFDLDVDHHPDESFRVVQMTPPGSACSITVGTGLTDAVPGSVRGLHLVVEDIEAASSHLVDHGVEAGEMFHFESGQRMPGPDPQRRDYGSFLSFSDPDGNGWLVQEVRRGRG